MDFNYAYNKPNSFFKNKKVKAIQSIENGAKEKIENGSVITIKGKSHGLKVYFDVFTDDGIHIYNVSHEVLEMIK